jgi:hypothetical protein
MSQAENTAAAPRRDFLGAAAGLLAAAGAAAVALGAPAAAAAPDATPAPDDSLLALCARLEEINEQKEALSHEYNRVRGELVRRHGDPAGRALTVRQHELYQAMLTLGAEVDRLRSPDWKTKDAALRIDWDGDPLNARRHQLGDEVDRLGLEMIDTADLIVGTPATSLAGLLGKVRAVRTMWLPPDAEHEYHEQLAADLLSEAERVLAAHVDGGPNRGMNRAGALVS